MSHVPSGAGILRRRRSLPALLLLLLLSACTRSGTETPAGPGDLASKGRTLYQAHCIACHNTDPAKPGSLGPEIANSPRELLEARVLRGEYPAGYRPKRTTHVMPPMPYLAKDIDALQAFLSSSRKQ